MLFQLGLHSGVRRVRPDENSLPRSVDAQGDKTTGDASILMLSMLSWALGIVGVRRVHPDENSFPFALMLKETEHQESIVTVCWGRQEDRQFKVS